MTSKKIANGKKENKDRIRELFFYGVFGVFSTLINLLVFKGLNEVCGLYYMWSNIIAWLAAVIFAFLTNKTIVFGSYSWRRDVWMKEVLDFLSARLLTGVMDMALMYIAVSLFGFDAWWSKIIVNVAVIIGNYVLSKLWVFKV